jgi:hypothetical protein
MKSLSEYINESCDGCYKISYGVSFDAEGTAYHQNIRITLSQHQLDKFNDLMKVMSNRNNYTGKFEPLQQGINYTSLSTCSEFCKMFKIDKDKRLRHENTVINLTIK